MIEEKNEEELINTSTADFFKIRLIVEALNDKEQEYLKHNELRRLILESVDADYALKADVRDEHVIEYIRGLIVPIIEANKHVLAIIKRDLEQARIEQRRQIQMIAKAFNKSMREKGEIEQTFEAHGSTVIVQCNKSDSDLIMIHISNEGGREEGALFLTTLAAAEYVVMNV